MTTPKLWEQLAYWQSDCTWVDLSHPLSPDTPHWVGWPALTVETKMDLDESIFRAHAYTTVGQYGTHVDAPSHMVDSGRTLDQIALAETVMPICVIDCCVSVAQNADYALCMEDIRRFEEQHGAIPERAFVIFRSDWSKRSPESYDNLDEAGNRHFPGWSLEALRFLVEERNIGGVGHETSDTDCPLTSGKTSYEVECYILSQDRIQVELLTNVDQIPAVGAIVFCTFPKVVGGSGFPCRCFALCPKG